MANPFMTAGTSVVATKSTTLPEFREFDGCVKSFV